MLVATHATPLGQITLAADAQGLAGAWFAGQQHFSAFGTAAHTLEDEAGGTRGGSAPNVDPAAAQALEAARTWLDTYFAGERPQALPPLHLMGTAFQLRVWRELLNIPFGTATTYGAIARVLEECCGGRTSARAVGSAVGRNPVSVIVPCHRVLGATGTITGYAGGLWRKRALLELERIPFKDATL